LCQRPTSTDTSANPILYAYKDGELHKAIRALMNAGKQDAIQPNSHALIFNFWSVTN
jgi:hypothetical protein